MVYPYDGRRDLPWHRDLVYRVAVAVPVPRLEDPDVDPLPTPYFYLDLPRKVICRAEGLTAVGQGNHSAGYDTDARVAAGAITIYHYPIRDLDQFTRKIRSGGAAYTRNTSVPRTAGWHWRRWYRMLLDGELTRAYAEALPSAARLTADLREGSALIDLTMTTEFDVISVDHPFRADASDVDSTGSPLSRG
jgi:hypothetical protein